MKRAKSYWLEAVSVLILIIYALWYGLCIYTPRDILDGLDWTLRLLVVPSFYVAVAYGLFRCLFASIIRKVNRKRCSIFVGVMAACILIYIMVMIFTWSIMSGDALIAYNGTVWYELLRITVKIGGSYLQEGISVVFGIALAFGVTGIQCKE